MTTILCTIVVFEAVSYACSGCTRWSSSEFIELKNRDGKISTRPLLQQKDRYLCKHFSGEIRNTDPTYLLLKK